MRKSADSSVWLWSFVTIILYFAAGAIALDARRSLRTNPPVVAIPQVPTIRSDRASAAQRVHDTAFPAATRAKAELINSESQPIGFTGYLKDSESGLYYAQARYYDPQIGRFTTQDPLEGNPMQPPSLHRYLYAYANPTTYTDPTGRCSDPICAWSLGMAYAHDDEERASITRATINTSPSFGRSAGALYEAGVQFAGPAQIGADTVAAMQGDIEAQQRWGDRFKAVEDFGERMQGAQRSYGPLGPPAQAFVDFSTSIGESAAQMQIAGDRLDYVSQGRTGLRFAGDLSTIVGGVGAARSLVGRAAVIESGGTARAMRDIAFSRIGASEPGAAVGQLQGLAPLDVGTYGDLTRRGAVGDDLTPDHIPSFAAMRANAERDSGQALSQSEALDLRNLTNCVTISGCQHRESSRTYGGRNTPTQIEEDSQNLSLAQDRDLAALRTRLLLDGHTERQVEEAFERLRQSNMQMNR